MESLYATLWPECLYAYPVGKIFNACQAIDKFAPLHNLKSVVVSPKTDCELKEMVFLQSSTISEVVS